MSTKLAAAIREIAPYSPLNLHPMLDAHARAAGVAAQVDEPTPELPADPPKRARKRSKKGA